MRARDRLTNRFFAAGAAAVMGIAVCAAIPAAAQPAAK